MKRLLLGVFILSTLIGCSDEKGKTNDAEAGEKQEPTQEETGNEEQESDDYYNHFDNATWKDDYRGLKSNISKIVTTNELPDRKESLVGIKLKVNNTTGEEFIYRPGYGTLVLSTGEQITNASDYDPLEINGEIYGGVEITSNINFLVESNVNDIEWIKFIWHVGQTGADNVYDNEKEYEVKLKLNK